MTLDTDGHVALPDELRVSAGGNLLHPADFGETEFAALDDGPPERISVEHAVSCAQAAFWEIDQRKSPGWGMHQPAVSSLIALLRPRTFVSLGVSDAGRFFAVCDAVHRLGIGTVCVAADTWSGPTSDDQFARVRRRMADQYSGLVGYVRAGFDEAASRFATGSVDLLHLSGSRPTSALLRAFETWSAKLSSRGVVLVDDLNEFGDGAGAWRFWRHAKQQHPHLELLNGGGLGVLLVGGACPLGKELVAPETSELLQALGGGIGQLSWKVTQLHRRNSGNSSNGGSDDQKRLAELQQRVRAMETSTSWRLTAPIRFVGRRARRLRRR